MLRSALVAKRTAGGWCLFILFALFWISDRWDSLNSLIGKLKKMGPVAKFLVDAAQSPFVQLCIFISGAIWIGVAAVISSRRTGSNSSAGTFYDAILLSSG